MTNGDDKDVVTRAILNEAVDAILEGMGKLVEDLRNDVNPGFENLKSEVRQNKTELKDETDGLKADLSATASRSELEELKSKLN